MRELLHRLLALGDTALIVVFDRGLPITYTYPSESPELTADDMHFCDVPFGNLRGRTVSFKELLFSF